MTIMPEVLACLDVAAISRLRNVEIRPKIAGVMGGKKNCYTMAVARVQCDDLVVKL
jgi:hypothetical protein